MKIYNPSGFSSKLTGSFSGSFVGDGSNITSISSDNIDFNFTAISSSAQIADDISGSFTSVSSSLESRITDNEGSVSSLNSSTSSYLQNTTDTLTGDLTVTGTITAQEFHTEFVSASIIYESGSTQFGNSSDDTHTFTGSIYLKDGEVGIGTNVNYFSEKLYVDGTTRLKDLHIAGEIGNSNYALVSHNDSYFELSTSGSRVSGTGDIIFSPYGNVGIGTTSPSHKLDVAGDQIRLLRDANDAVIRVANTTGNAGAYFTANSGYTGYSGIELQTTGTTDWYLGSFGYADFSITDGTKDAGTRVFTIQNTTGNVGIGTNSPEFELDVTGIMRTTAFLVVSGSDNQPADIVPFNRPSGSSVNIGTYISSYGFIDISSTHNDGGWVDFSDGTGIDYRGRIRYFNSVDTFKIYTGESGIATMEISSANKVSIGGASTDGYLEIRQSDNTSSIRLNNGANPDGAYYDITSRTDGKLYLNRNGSTVSVLSDSNGNVGIGTDSPADKLDVNGHSTFRGQGSASTGTINLVSPDSFIRLDTTGGTTDKQKWDIRAISATGYEALEFRTVNDANNSFNTRLWLSHSGNVGIGTTPSLSGVKLHTYNNSTDAYNIFESSTNKWVFGEAGGACQIGGRYGHHSGINVDTAGQVGIGTASPASKLTVNGGVNNVWAYSTATTDQPGFVAADNTTFGTATNILYSKLYGSGITANAFGQTLGNWAIVASSESSNNGLIVGTFSNKPLIIGTNAIERMRITSSGDVELKPANPVSMASADTNYLGFRITQTNAQSALLGTIYGQGVSGWGGKLVFRTKPDNGTPNDSTTVAMVIDENQDIGIGTTDPFNTYSGVSILGSDASIAQKTTSASGWTWSQYVNSSGTNNFSAGVNHSVPYWGVKAGAGMDNPHLSVNSDGNVGVGTNSASNEFHVNGESTLQGTNIFGFTGNNYGGNNHAHTFAGYGVPAGASDRYSSYGFIILNANTNYTGAARKFGITNAFQANKFAILIGSSSLAAPGLGDYGNLETGTTLGLVMTNTGEVGIGTDSPSVGFHVEQRTLIDSGTSSDIITFQNDNGGFVLGNTTNQASVDLSSGQALRIRQSSNSRIFVNTNGEVILGSDSVTTISTDFIHSIGNVNRSSLTSAMYARLVMQERTGDWISFVNGTPVHFGTISVSGNGVNYGSNSDYRLKDNILDLTNSINKVKLLSPKTFNFIDRPDNNVTGFLAHEVQEVIPEAVTGERDGTITVGNVVKDSDGTILEQNIQEPETLETGTSFTSTSTEPKYQQLDPAKLVPVLTGALKELIAKVETLEAEVEALKNA